MSNGDGFYQTPEWKHLRAQALRRDCFKCVVCGASVVGKGRSRVDHILDLKRRPDLAMSLDNLRTLCSTCDNKRHAEKMGANPNRGAALDGTPLDPAHPWNQSTCPVSER